MRTSVASLAARDQIVLALLQQYPLGLPISACWQFLQPHGWSDAVVRLSLHRLRAQRLVRQDTRQWWLPCHPAP